MADVIDASVAIKWFVDEPGREKALQILADVIRRPRSYCVPELFYFELANIFNRLVPRPSDRQRKLFDVVLSLGMHRLVMTPELYSDVKFFQDRGLSGYDAAYVAVAKNVSGKWITFDAKAHKTVARSGLSRLLLL